LPNDSHPRLPSLETQESELSDVLSHQFASLWRQNLHPSRFSGCGSISSHDLYCCFSLICVDFRCILLTISARQTTTP
jgi:hypothetical protein